MSMTDLSLYYAPYNVYDNTVDTKTKYGDLDITETRKTALAILSLTSRQTFISIVILAEVSGVARDSIKVKEFEKLIMALYKIIIICQGKL
jgi:hypothetical protein